jgi:hypothetical protein
MARITLNQTLAKAMALDAEYGTEHRGDAVLCQMLAAIPAHLERKNQQARQLLKSRQAASAGTTRAARADEDDLDDDEKVRRASAEGNTPSPHTTDHKVRRSAAASGSTAQRSGSGQGVGSPKSKTSPVAVMAKSTAASPASQPAPARSWSPQQIAAALDDGVRSGRISGTAAMAGMRAITGKR